jgi:hypothetical protein
MGEYPGDQGPGAGFVPEAAGRPRPIVLTPLGQDYLDQTRPWVRFMSIVTFAAAGLMVLVGIGLLVASLAGGLSNGDAAFPAGAIGGGLFAIFYVAMALLYVAPGLFLSRYATAIRLLRTQGEGLHLEDALKHQKSFWRFVGILTAIGIVLSLVMLGFAVVLGMLAAATGLRA